MHRFRPLNLPLLSVVALLLVSLGINVYQMNTFEYTLANYVVAQDSMVTTEQVLQQLSECHQENALKDSLILALQRSPTTNKAGPLQTGSIQTGSAVARSAKLSPTRTTRHLLAHQTK